MTSKAANDLAKLIYQQFMQSEEGRNLQASINSAMAGAIDDVRRGNPNALDPPVKVTPLGAQRMEDDKSLSMPQSGWKEEAEKHFVRKGSFEDQLIDRMVEKFAGPVNAKPNE